MDYKGKVALVTGAASGMGRMTAQRLARRGATVAALDIDAEGLAKTKSMHPNMKTYVCDISDLASVKSVVSQVKQDLGEIDRLVHCAAVMPLCPLKDTSIEKIQQVMRINFEGTVYIASTVLPAMVARDKGEMIIFGSTAGDIPMPYGGAYAASKGAVNSYVRQLITENIKNSVKIMLVCPPAVNTPLLSYSRTGMNYDFEKQRRNKLVVEPEVILDIVDRAFEKNKKVVYPSWVAKFVVWFFRLLPEFSMKQTLNSALKDVVPSIKPAMTASSKAGETQS